MKEFMERKKEIPLISLWGLADMQIKLPIIKEQTKIANFLSLSTIKSPSKKQNWTS
jgi:hypothetical protein